MEFPHLNDTRYPNIDNVDTYSYRNEFDYTRWTPDTRLKLCNVRWNGDYDDVVKFDSDAERDSYFDGISGAPGASAVLTANSRVVQNTVKVPIPYDVACAYNYLLVEVPIATSAGNMIQHEETGGYRRWHFFVTDWLSTAPSTTTLTLQLDAWTQYVNRVGVSGMMLERGHAPVAATDTDRYLANPMLNCDYLLAPDVNLGGDTVSEGGRFIPIGNGAKMLCMASTCPPESLSSLGTAGTYGGFTDPTFSDAENYPDKTNRWGRQYIVNGYSWGDGKDYSGCKVPTNNSLGDSSAGRIPSSATVYCVRSEYAESFIQIALAETPTFLRTLTAVFMVPKDMLEIGTKRNVGRQEVWECVSQTTPATTDIKLTKDMFGYPSEYERFAKLYTFPYAELEITDNDGKTATVRIETCGSAIKANTVASIAYPYLNMRTFITGIGGTGSTSYKWVDLLGSYSDQSMPNSDWHRLCFDMGIPLYSIYMDGETAWKLNNSSRQVTCARDSALTGYHNSVRQANNVDANSVEANDTALINAKASAYTQESINSNTAYTQEANAGRTADMLKDNADRSADTYKTNEDNSADAAKTNTDNAADTDNTNTHNQANTIDANNANNRSAASAITAQNNRTLGANTAQDNTLIDTKNAQTQSLNAASTRIGNALTSTTTKEENQVTTSTAMNNLWSSGINAAITGTAAVAAGAVTANPGAAVTGLASAAASIVDAGFGVANAASTTQANSAVADATVAANSANQEKAAGTDDALAYASTSHNLAVKENTTACNTANTDTSNDCNSKNTSNTTGTMRTNGDNTASMLKGNATRTQSTRKTNAGNTQSTQKTNAAATQATQKSNAEETRITMVTNGEVLCSTQISNAENTQVTGNTNANYTRDAATVAAQDVLRNAQNAAKSALSDSSRENPVTLTPASGDAGADFFATRGIQVKARRQSRHAIAAAASAFARYGYALNMYWEPETLTPMKHFSYWKCSDAWVYDKDGSNDSAQRAIAGILNRGVTVWSNPDEIGKVSIYDN